jgi:hypothetical protein
VAFVVPGGHRWSCACCAGSLAFGSSPVSGADIWNASRHPRWVAFSFCPAIAQRAARSPRVTWARGSAREPGSSFAGSATAASPRDPNPGHRPSMPAADDPPSRGERRGRRGSPGQEALRASRAPPSRARRRPRPLAIPIQATGRRCPLRTTRPRAASGAVAAGRLGERYCARARRVLRGLEDGRLPPRSHARLPAVDARSGRPGLALCGVGSIG